MTAPLSLQRILVVKLADFGDALLTTPALAALRRTYPDAVIDVLTTPGAAVVYRHSGLVDEVLTFQKGRYDRPARALLRPAGPLALGRRLRGRRYDAVVFFHHLTTRFGALKHALLALATGAPVRAGLAWPGAGRAWFLTHRALDVGFDRRHEVEHALAVVAAVGADGADERAEYIERRLVFVPDEKAEVAARVILSEAAANGRALKGRVAIHPGCGPFSPARRWPAERFAAVAERLAESGWQVILVGTDADDTAAVRQACGAEVLDLTDLTDLPTLAALLRQVDLLIANDSGVMHLATAMSTPVLAIFGPSNPVAWGPWGAESGGLGVQDGSLQDGRLQISVMQNGVTQDGRMQDGRTQQGELLHRVPRHRVVALDGLPCRPCFYVGHRLGAPNGCPTRDCLTWLSAGEITRQALEMLNRREVTVP